jgi:hypothetical protein
MKIFLQSTKSLKLLSNRKQQRRESWTTEPAEARVFASALDALFYCYRRGVPNMQILAEFADSRPNITLSITSNRMT